MRPTRAGTLAGPALSGNPTPGPLWGRGDRDRLTQATKAALSNPPRTQPSFHGPRRSGGRGALRARACARASRPPLWGVICLGNQAGNQGGNLQGKPGSNLTVIAGVIKANQSRSVSGAYGHFGTNLPHNGTRIPGRRG